MFRFDVPRIECASMDGRASRAGPECVHAKRLRRLCLANLVFLLTQFVLGMATNLFVNIPRSHPGTSGSYVTGSARAIGWALAHGPTELAAHVALGLLLVLGAIGLVGQSARFERRVRIAAISGGVFVVAAGFNGAAFLDYNRDLNSFLMALLFALATLAYVIVLYHATEQPV